MDPIRSTKHKYSFIFLELKPVNNKKKRLSTGCDSDRQKNRQSLQNLYSRNTLLHFKHKRVKAVDFNSFSSAKIPQNDRGHSTVVSHARLGTRRSYGKSARHLRLCRQSRRYRTVSVDRGGGGASCARHDHHPPQCSCTTTSGIVCTRGVFNVSFMLRSHFPWNGNFQNRYIGQAETSDQACVQSANILLSSRLHYDVYHLLWQEEMNTDRNLIKFVVKLHEKMST